MGKKKKRKNDGLSYNNDPQIQTQAVRREKKKKEYTEERERTLLPI